MQSPSAPKIPRTSKKIERISIYLNLLQNFRYFEQIKNYESQQASKESNEYCIDVVTMVTQLCRRRQDVHANTGCRNRSFYNSLHLVFGSHTKRFSVSTSYVIRICFYGISWHHYCDIVFNSVPG